MAMIAHVLSHRSMLGRRRRQIVHWSASPASSPGEPARACYTVARLLRRRTQKADGSMARQQTIELTPDTIFGILAEHREDLRALGVRALGLFGSFRRGEAHVESDMDFLVTLDQPTLRSYMAVKELIEHLFGRSVDLVMADAIKPRIRGRIFAEVVYVPGFSPVSG